MFGTEKINGLFIQLMLCGGTLTGLNRRFITTCFQKNWYNCKIGMTTQPFGFFVCPNQQFPQPFLPSPQWKSLHMPSCMYALNQELTGSPSTTSPLGFRITMTN